jgi:hypothetical protein
MRVASTSFISHKKPAMPNDFTISIENAKDLIAIEALNFSPIVSKLKELLPSITASFAKMRGFVQTQDPINIQGFTATQTAAINAGEKHSYAELREIKVQVPQGMQSDFVTTLEALLLLTQHVKGAYRDVLQPYVQFLAQVAGHDGSRLATNDERKHYEKLEENREALISGLTKCFGSSTQSHARYGDAVARNADLPKIFELAKACGDTINSVTPKQVKDCVSQASDYLGVLYENLNTAQDPKTSHEFAQHLSLGAYQVAKEVELYSLTHYRVLVMVQSVSELSKTLNKFR